MNDGILGTPRARGGNPARPLATTAESVAGADSRSVVTPQAMHLARRGSGRAWFWEAFTDFAFDYSNVGTGSDGIVFAPGSSGTGSSADVFSNHPESVTGRPAAGILTMNTGTTNTGRGGITSFNSRPVVAANGPIYTEVLAAIPTLATGAEDYVARVGNIRNDGLVSSPVLAFEYDRSTNANWRGLHLDNSSNVTRTDLGIPVTAGAWVKLGILHTTSIARFFINDAEVGSLAVNAPNSMWLGGHIIKTAGTTNRTFLMDYFYVRQDFLRERTYS